MCVESVQYVESLKNVVDDVFEVGEKPTNCVSGWWFVESAVVPQDRAGVLAQPDVCRRCPCNSSAESHKRDPEADGLVFRPLKGGRTPLTPAETRTQDTRTAVLSW